MAGMDDGPERLNEPSSGGGTAMSRYFYALAVLITALFCISLVACSPRDMQGASVRIEIQGGHGSGSHIGNRLILTAAHVVEGQTSIDIVTHDGRRMPAKVLWTAKAFDISVIQYEGDLLPAAEVACTSAKPGDRVTAYGNPLAARFARFSGEVSAAPGPQGIWASVQVMDVTGAPGISGGGVFNVAGKLVGVFVGGYATQFAPVSGITLMVPASAVCRMLGR